MKSGARGPARLVKRGLYYSRARSMHEWSTRRGTYTRVAKRRTHAHESLAEERARVPRSPSRSSREFHRGFRSSLVSRRAVLSQDPRRLGLSHPRGCSRVDHAVPRSRGRRVSRVLPLTRRTFDRSRRRGSPTGDDDEESRETHRRRTWWFSSSSTSRGPTVTAT